MVIYYLLMTLCVIFLLSYFGFSGDIFSPGIIINIGYIFAVLCCTYLINIYNVSLSWNTYLVIVIGIISFVAPSFFIKQYISKSKKIRNTNRINNIIPSKIISISVIVFIFITSILFIYNVFKVVGFSGMLSDVTYVYRSMGYDGSSLQPFYINQMMKVVRGFVYVYLYIFIYNVIFNGFSWGNCVNAIPILLFLITTIVGASRTDFLTIFLMGITIYYYLYAEKNSWRLIANWRFIRYAFLSVCIFLILFSSMRVLVGRKNDNDFMLYIANYAGGSIELLDLYIQENGISQVAEEFGEETFLAFRDNLTSIFSTKNKTSLHQEFRSANGILIGNVYTGMRKYIHDFGVGGLVFIQMLLGTIYTILYESLKRKGNGVKLIIYAYIFVPIIKHFIQEEVLSAYFCINTIVMMLIIYFAYFILVRLKVKLR